MSMTGRQWRARKKALRRFRKEAHDEIDALTKLEGVTRGDVYRWLAQALGMQGQAFHMSLLDEAQLWAVVRTCRRIAAAHNRPHVGDSGDTSV